MRRTTAPTSPMVTRSSSWGRDGAPTTAGDGEHAANADTTKTDRAARGEALGVEKDAAPATWPSSAMRRPSIRVRTSPAASAGCADGATDVSRMPVTCSGTPCAARSDLFSSLWYLWLSAGEIAASDTTRGEPGEARRRWADRSRGGGDGTAPCRGRRRPRSAVVAVAVAVVVKCARRTGRAPTARTYRASSTALGRRRRPRWPPRGRSARGTRRRPRRG